MEIEINLPGEDDAQLLHCRFCAEEKNYEDLLNLFSDKADRIANILFELKMDYINITETNKLPKTICESCYVCLDNAYEFLSMVKQSQVYLNTINHIKEEFQEQEEEIIKDEKCDEREDESSNDQYLNSEQHTEVITPKIEFADNTITQITYTNDMVPNETTEVIIQRISPENISNNTNTFKTILQSNELLSNAQIKDEKEQQTDDADKSWMSYPWPCVHCQLKFDTMEEVRTHSKLEHSKCFGFSCVDCKYKFNHFNAFVEHVRQHREALRNYCQYCNLKFDTPAKCHEHCISHWEGTQKICILCGEILPDTSALERHKDIYKKVHIRANRNGPAPHPVALPMAILQSEAFLDGVGEKSWKDYEWTCQDCCLKMPDVDSLRKHVQEVHNKCFSMKCMDCLRIMKNFIAFVNHVCEHRPYLKHYCQYCNADIRDSTKLDEHIKEHITGPQRPCDGCGQIFENNTILLKHMKEYDAPRSKGAHLTPEDLTCDICNKCYPTLPHLRNHRKSHNANRERHYTCDTCGKAFLTGSTLKTHIITHDLKAHKCHICKKAFHMKKSLEDHVATHLEEKCIQCDQCGKKFRSTVRLRSHLRCHTDVKSHKCTVCGKLFRYSGSLKTHMHQHTGARPYACQMCDKTFANYGNCSKHMTRKHGISLAKMKAVGNVSKTQNN